MQEIIKADEKKANRTGRATYSALSIKLLKNRYERVVLSVLVLIFGIACSGTAAFTQAFLSLCDFDMLVLRVFSSEVLFVLTLFLDFSMFAFLLFPFLLGIYAYALDFVNTEKANLELLFFYYRKRNKYFFAVRYCFRLMLILASALALSYLVSRLGIVLSQYFANDADIVRATIFLAIAFAGVTAFFVAVLLRMCDLFAVVSVSQECNSSLNTIFRISAALTRGFKKKVITHFFLSAISFVFILFSAGLLAIPILPKLAVSRALLERDIINEFKNKNNI